MMLHIITARARVDDAAQASPDYHITAGNDLGTGAALIADMIHLGSQAVADVDHGVEVGELGQLAGFLDAGGEFEVAAGEAGGMGFRLFYRVTRTGDGAAIALVENGMACFDYAKRRVAPLPAAVRAWLAAAGRAEDIAALTAAENKIAQMNQQLSAMQQGLEEKAERAQGLDSQLADLAGRFAGERILQARNNIHRAVQIKEAAVV